MKKGLFVAFLIGKTLLCSNASAQGNNTGKWVTNVAQKQFLHHEKLQLEFKPRNTDGGATIVVDSSKNYQFVDGFGFCLTGSSAFVINQLPDEQRTKLLKELFGNGADDIGVSYIRLTIGASDLSPSVYTYDDMPSGETDKALSKFSLGPDQKLIVPLVKEILKINPRLKILASPWSAPAWMKDNYSLKGGSLAPAYYPNYTGYLLKYIQAMATNGIKIDAITLQNEPLCTTNNPSMKMTAEEQAKLIKSYVGPTFAQQNITTKIIIYDHNCDNVEYPKTLLSDPEARKYVAGTAFHLYAGQISALSDLHSFAPDKNVYFTEQYTDAKGDFTGDLKWHTKNLIIGAMRNFSRNVIEWNLASDSKWGPHTNDGGCSVCKGALTIEGAKITRNVPYYVIAHASKFVPVGSKRCWSSNSGDINTVAFKTPEGKMVLIVENDGGNNQTIKIQFAGNVTQENIQPNSVATFVW